MRRRFITFLIVVALIVVAVLLWITARAPAQSSVGANACLSGQQGCLRFPVISGDNLLGQSFTLPADFKGSDVLVIVPFDENQQVSAQTWLPLARDLAADDPDFAYYNVPVFPSMAAPLRALIRSGMTLSITDPQLRAITITVFLDDRDSFLASLNIPNADAMQVFLLDASGDLLWRGAGDYDSGQGAALTALVK